MQLRCFVWLAIAFSVPVHAALHFEVRKIIDRQRHPFPVSQSVKPIWILNEESVRVLVIELTLQASEFSSYNRVKTLSPSTKASLKGDTLVARLSGLSEKFLLKGGANNLAFEIEGRETGEQPVVDNNCDKLLLALRPAQKPLPFYVGTSCQKVNDALTFSITLPKEVEFTKSTLFESKGKGESWRYYELGSVKGASGTLGRFTLRYQKKPYEFSLDSLIAVSSKAKAQRARTLLAVGAGYGLLKIGGSDMEASDTKPTLLLRIPHYPVWGNLGVVFNMDFAMPLDQGANSVSYTHFEGFSAYLIELGAVLQVRPKLGYVISMHSHDSGVTLSANEMGAGLGLDFRLGENSVITIDAMGAGLVSTVISDHYSFAVGFTRKSAGSVGWGAGAKLQQFTTISELEIERKFTQTLFWALAAF